MAGMSFLIEFEIYSVIPDVCDLLIDTLQCGKDNCGKNGWLFFAYFKPLNSNRIALSPLHINFLQNPKEISE